METQGNFCEWDDCHFSEIDMKVEVWGDNSVMHAFDSDVSANQL